MAVFTGCLADLLAKSPEWLFDEELLAVLRRCGFSSNEELLDEYADILLTLEEHQHTKE